MVGIYWVYVFWSRIACPCHMPWSCISLSQFVPVLRNAASQWNHAGNGIVFHQTQQDLFGSGAFAASFARPRRGRPGGVSVPRWDSCLCTLYLYQSNEGTEWRETHLWYQHQTISCLDVVLVMKWCLLWWIMIIRPWPDMTYGIYIYIFTWELLC